MPDRTGIQAEIRFLGELNRLEVWPGDRFVLQVDALISPELAARIQEEWREFIGQDHPEIRLLILEKGMKIGAIRLPDQED
jgi:hypothetical protein